MDVNNKYDILFILPLLSGGGAERVSINLLTGLYNRGYSVGIITFDKSGPLLSIVPNNVPIYDLGTFTLKFSILPLAKKLRQLKPRVVFSTLGYINVALLAIRIFLPREIKIWTREANLPSISLPNNAKSRLMIAFYKLLYKTADKLICTSIRMKKEFITDFSVSEDIIEILPNLVDVDAIRTSAFPIKRFDKGGVCYIAAGRLTFQKGFDRLLYWFSKLNDKQSTIVILGHGNLKSELIRESESLNLQDRVKFLGFCNNPWQWYMGADAFLLSSRWEGMPNSVLEALACGTPVIATEESGGIKEIINDDENNGIISVIESQQFVEYMGKVKIKDKSFVLKSLLPERYRKENVMHIVEGWLNEIK